MTYFLHFFLTIPGILAKIRLFCHQRYCRWRGAVPPLWLRPKELPRMVQVKMYFVQRLDLHRVKIKLKIKKTLKTFSLWWFDSHECSGRLLIYFLSKIQILQRKKLPTPREWWVAFKSSKQKYSHWVTEPLLIFWDTEQDKGNDIRNGDGYDSKSNNAGHESPTVIMVNVSNSCGCVERR